MDIRISDWTKLGSVIRDARKRRGLSQHELANRAGVSRSWLARMEVGHRGAELEPLFRLLNALEMALVLRDPARSQEPQTPDEVEAARLGARGERLELDQGPRHESPRARAAVEKSGEKVSDAAASSRAANAARTLANSDAIRRATESARKRSAQTEAARRTAQVTPQMNAAADAARKAQAAIAPTLSVIAKHQKSAAGRRQAWQDASTIDGPGHVQEAIKRASRLAATAERASGAERQVSGRPKRGQPDHAAGSSGESDSSADGRGRG